MTVSDRIAARRAAAALADQSLEAARQESREWWDRRAVEREESRRRFAQRAI